MKKSGKRSPRTPVPQVRRSDRHAFYETAVQRPEIMTGFLESLLARRRKQAVLREDFCGSAHLAATWVLSGAGRRAVATDIDPQVIRVARRRARDPLGAAADRLELICGDVRQMSRKADLIVALNFSWCVFHDREALKFYLQNIRRSLKPGGRAVLDLYGGPAALQPCIEKRKFGDFTYVWEQEWFDVRSARVRNHIHFEFPGGRKMRRAFTYDWRLWTLPEVEELCGEAGLKIRDTFFEDESGWIGRTDPSEAEAWVVYLVIGK